MILPWTYRPTSPDDLDWEDTIGSNLMAWVSDYLAPWFGASEHGPAVKLAIYFWTDCSVCLFWRGAFFGIATGLAVGLAI